MIEKKTKTVSISEMRRNRVKTDVIKGNHYIITEWGNEIMALIPMEDYEKAFKDGK